MKRFLSGATALSLVFALAACGDDGAGLDEGDLSDEEAAALSNVVMQQALVSGFGALAGGFGTDGPQGVTFSENLSNTESCPMGGSVSVSGGVTGDINPNTGASTVSLDIDMTHNACGVQDPSSGMIFTLNGSPNIGVNLDMSLSGASGSYSGSYSGAVSWQLSGRAGVCSLSINYSGTINSGYASVDLSGTVCGQSISYSG